MTGPLGTMATPVRATTPGAPGSSEPAASAGTRVRAWLKRRRTTLVITLALVAAVLVVVFTQDGVGQTGDLDPQNPGLDGAQALAQVLGDEGVNVEIVRSADALAEADAAEDATVVVTSTQNLGPSTVDRLLSDTAGATLVVVDAGPGVVEAFDGVEAPSRDSLGDGRVADCDLSPINGLTLEVDTAFTYPSGDGCFAQDGRSVLIRADSGLFFGGGQALRNDQILRADNAAIGLRALGQRDRLVWYVPDFADAIAGESTTLSSLIPRWIFPGLFLAGLTSIALVLWRARRLGPLATEPLPVVVKAIETTQSRGRLYRRAGDRGHAADVLRRAARGRAAERLRLGRGTSEGVVVRDLARHLGRPESEVADLIGSSAPVPASDKELITLANDLAEIDREAHTP